MLSFFRNCYTLKDRGKTKAKSKTVNANSVPLHQQRRKMHVEFLKTV